MEKLIWDSRNDRIKGGNYSQWSQSSMIFVEENTANRWLKRFKEENSEAKIGYFSFEGGSTASGNEYKRPFFQSEISYYEKEIGVHISLYSTMVAILGRQIIVPPNIRAEHSLIQERLIKKGLLIVADDE